ncbi:MAG: divergent polysaccharide deacetylase family protein, partial [Alphaproteobacteria bacterium]|nr:divergent polysaccharide deacetylase family protein [Alphaproteobacteria bacterium]
KVAARPAEPMTTPVTVALTNPAKITLAPAPKPPTKRTWEANAVAFSAAPGTPLIAIVLDDMGLNRRRSDRAVRLPGPLTLSYLSYANNLAAQTGAARARGHELMLHLPMEPTGEADPGPGALLVHLGNAELQARIDFGLGRFTGFVGINNHMGSRFTADRGRMSLVFQAMYQSGHLFLDSVTTPGSVALSLGAETGVPTIARDVFLDDVDSQDEVWFRLLKAERIAETQGTAIAIGHPRDATLAVLEDWIAELSRRPARLAPLSAVARIRLGRHHQVTVKP